MRTSPTLFRWTAFDSSSPRPSFTSDLPFFYSALSALPLFLADSVLLASWVLALRLPNHGAFLTGFHQLRICLFVPVR